MARDSKDIDEFHERAAKPKESASHDSHSEPLDHHMGFSLANAVRVGTDMNQNVDPRLNFWEDGNGSNNEKADAWNHL